MGSKKIKVLLAGHVGPPFGGIGTYCQDLLHSSLREKVLLSFVQTSAGTMRISERGAWKLPNLLNAMGNVYQFCRAVITTRPDLVHITTAYGASFLKNSLMVLIARGLGAKVVLQPHCTISKILPDSPQLRFRFAVFIFRQCNGVLVLSNEWLALQKWVHCPVRYVPNGINIEPYLGLSKDIKKVETSERWNILYLGYLVYEKGILDLIEAVGILASNAVPAFLVTLIGEDGGSGEVAGIMNTIRKKGLGNWFLLLPPKFSQEKLDAFAAADIFVLPSHHEGMPMTIIEAMASELPVVATYIGGIPDLVVPEVTGILVPASEPAELAKAIQALIGNRDLCFRLGQAGRKRAEQMFNINDRAVEIELFYRQIVHGSFLTGNFTKSNGMQ